MVELETHFIATVFGQLGLNPNTTSLLATGVYGIVNVSLSTSSLHHLFANSVLDIVHSSGYYFVGQRRSTSSVDVGRCWMLYFTRDRRLADRCVWPRLARTCHCRTRRHRHVPSLFCDPRQTETETDASGYPAFVFIYDVNFSYSWAPIGWGTQWFTVTLFAVA